MFIRDLHGQACPIIGMRIPEKEIRNRRRVITLQGESAHFEEIRMDTSGQVYRVRLPV